MSTRELRAAALKLPPRLRAALAEQLLSSLDSDARRAIDDAWADEAESRVNAFDAGKIKAKPISRVLARLARRTGR